MQKCIEPAPRLKCRKALDKAVQGYKQIRDKLRHGMLPRLWKPVQRTALLLETQVAIPEGAKESLARWIESEPWL